MDEFSVFFFEILVHENNEAFPYIEISSIRYSESICG